MEEKLKDEEVLLVADKRTPGKVEVATGKLDEKGEPETVTAENKNEPAFLKLNKNDDILESFFKNFLRQTKEPTHFHFFRMPLAMLQQSVIILKEMLKDEEGNSIFLSQQSVKPEDYAKNSVNESLINWDELAKRGVSREQLEKDGQLQDMLDWKKSPDLVTLKIEIAGEVFESKARLSFEEENGVINPKFHPYQSTVNLDSLFKGVYLPDDMKTNLAATGHGGRAIELEFENGKELAIVSIDKKTNRLEALPVSQINIPDNFKGANLTDEIKAGLLAGREELVEGMISKYNTKFDGKIRINADTKSFEFNFEGLDRNRYKKVQEKPTETTKQFRFPKVLKGVVLNDTQYNKIKNLEAAWVEGLDFGDGKLYNRFAKANLELGKIQFFRWNPDKKKEQKVDNPTQGDKAKEEQKPQLRKPTKMKL